MSKLKSSISSTLTVIAFLALTAVSAVLYGGNEEQKAKMENNFFWQKARWALDLAFAVAPTFISPEAYPDSLGVEPAGSGDARLYDPGREFATPSDSSSGFWSGLAERLKAEWDRGATEGTNSDFDNLEASDFVDQLDIDVAASGFFDWERTEAGTDIVFRRQSGEEYRISLPFGFFRRD